MAGMPPDKSFSLGCLFWLLFCWWHFIFPHHLKLVYCYTAREHCPSVPQDCPRFYTRHIIYFKANIWQFVYEIVGMETGLHQVVLSGNFQVRHASLTASWRLLPCTTNTSAFFQSFLEDYPSSPVVWVLGWKMFSVSKSTFVHLFDYSLMMIKLPLNSPNLAGSQPCSVAPNLKLGSIQWSCLTHTFTVSCVLSKVFPKLAGVYIYLLWYATSSSLISLALHPTRP